MRREKDDAESSVEEKEDIGVNSGPSGGRANRRRDRKKHGRRRDMRIKDRRKKKNNHKFGYTDGIEKRESMVTFCWFFFFTFSSL